MQASGGDIDFIDYVDYFKIFNFASRFLGTKTVLKEFFLGGVEHQTKFN